MRHRLLLFLIVLSAPASGLPLAAAAAADAAADAGHSAMPHVAARPDGWRRTASGWEWAGTWDLGRPTRTVRDAAAPLCWHERFAAAAGEIHPMAVAAGLLGTALILAAGEGTCRRGTAPERGPSSA